jgi:hypothetical protein
MICKYAFVVLAASLVGLTACETTSKLTFPIEFDKNHRSSEIDQRLLKDGLTRVFDYRVFSDSLLGFKDYDSTMTYGLILPLSSTREGYLHKKTLFGNDSAKCTIHVQTYIREIRREKNSFVSSLLSGGNKDYSDNGPSVDRLYDLTVGTIEKPSFSRPSRFRLEKFDSPDQARKTNGYLVIGEDSLVIEPIFAEVNPPLNKLFGLRLFKNGLLYAVLQHDPNYILGRDTLHVYTKATADEQLTIAAFFTMIDQMF